jgi:UDP-glucose 6-dehydrogenase
MENAFLATKVAFVNQFYDLAQAFGVSFNELREIWLADERIGRSHTIVTEERGYRGRCLPKDMAAIIHEARKYGGAPLLEAIDRYNDEVCRRADEKRRTAPL